MDSQEIGRLFEGRAPSLEEFASFGYACSQLSYAQLYEVALGFPDIHWLLKETVRKHLEEKIQAENKRLRSEELTDAISKRLTGRD